MQHSIFPLTDNECGACEAALHLSQHTKIALLPSVHINEHMELGGFHFESAGCDTANVLPITTSMFDCIVAHEVGNELHASFNDRVLHVLQNMDEHKKKLGGVIAELKGHTAHVPAFSCMVDDNDDEALNDDELVFTKHSCDRDVWDEQVPRKVGLYHSFVRPHTKDSIEHKLFIVVSGSLPFLDEEFHRLWQDCNTFTTCEQLLESEELYYLLKRLASSDSMRLEREKNDFSVFMGGCMYVAASLVCKHFMYFSMFTCIYQGKSQMLHYAADGDDGNGKMVEAHLEAKADLGTCWARLGECLVGNGTR